MFLIGYFIISALVIPQILCSNILFFHLIATSSHRTSIWPLAEKLADRGHNVTYIFPMQKRIGSHPKIAELVPSKMLPILHSYVGDFDINFRLNNSVNEWTMQIFSKSVELCQAFYESPEVHEWLSKPKLSYDLVMIDGSLGECAYGLVHKFKAKHVLFYPTTVPPFTWDAVGIVPESASVPEAFFHMKPNDMSSSIVSKVLTTASVFLWRLGLLDFMRRLEPVIKSQLNFTAGNEMPSMLDMERNTNLVLVNTHFVEDYPLALPPMIQSFSGLWCSKDKLRERKPLPEDLEKFIESGNEEGFIYVSFGSAVMSSAMPTSLLKEFFSALESFPKMRFLWRWPGESKPSGVSIPKNMLFRSWFPQHDLLAHPKIRAFITQGGRPSTQEALCNAVPMIAIPIFGDQDYNVDRLEYIGGAIAVDIDNLRAESLTNAIKSIVSVDTYRNKMVELSTLFRDRPLDPLDNAVYWTEYVLRHNTSLLKPLGMNQHWFQRRLLDVYAFIAIVITSFIGILLYLLKLLIYRCANLNRVSKIKGD